MFHDLFVFFFFNDTATTEIYTLSLHDALPIFLRAHQQRALWAEHYLLQSVKEVLLGDFLLLAAGRQERSLVRSEEHTSELQSRQYLVCRLLLEKKKKKID